MDNQALYDSYYNPIAAEVNKYADELINIAKGDYDFTAKWIEKEYTNALGTGDTELAAFLRQVASGVEQKQGTIAFDYNTGKYRLEQDAKIPTDRTNRNTSRTLQRLQEDEVTMRTQNNQAAQQQRSMQDASLNSRGLVTATRDNATGLQGKEVGQLEQSIADRQASLERAVGRNRQDVLTGQSDTLADINTNFDRGLMDLTTGARRAALGAQNQRDYGIESANRGLGKATNAAEQERRRSLNQAKGVANYYAQGRLA